MKPPIKVFEPIPKPLIKSLHFKGKTHGFSENDVYRLVTDLTGIPIMTALSKQEALFLIGTITRQTARAVPLPPPLENGVEGGSTLPSFYHVKEIRFMFRALEWDKAQIKGWLEKYVKVEDFRTMDRQQAQKAFYALGKILDRKQGADGQQHG